MLPVFQPHLQLLIPVDVVNFVTPVKTAGVNRRREQATRQKFYVNKLGYGSTSGGRKIQAIASVLSRVDGVSGADDNYDKVATLKAFRTLYYFAFSAGMEGYTVSTNNLSTASPSAR